MRVLKRNWSVKELQLNLNKLEEMDAIYTNVDREQHVLNQHSFYYYYDTKKVDDDHIVILFYVEKKHLEKFINKWAQHIRMLSDQRMRTKICSKIKDFYKILMEI